MDDFQEQCDRDEDVLQLTVMLKRVKGDNVELRRNFESLKNMHVQLNEEHKQLQVKYSDLQEERITVERQYQGLCESWRVELEEKQRQFEQVKAQILAPRDLEVMQITMMERIEAPLRTKCDMLAKEAEVAQQNFVRLRREHEEVSASLRSLEIQSRRDQEAITAECTAVVNELKDRLAAQGQIHVKLSQAEAKVKVAEREKAEMTFHMSKLKDEIQELRLAKDKADAAKGSVELRVERKVKAIQAEEVQLSGLVETLTRKNRHLQKELVEAQRSNEEMFEQCMKLQAGQATLQTQLEAQRKQHAADAAAQEDQHLAAARDLEDKIMALRDEVHGKERQMAEMHINHQEQMTSVIESQSLRIEEAEREHGKRARELREQNQELLARAETLRDGLDECRRELGDVQHQLQRETESNARQLERLNIQLTECQHQVSAKEVEVAQLRREVDGLKSDHVRLEISCGQLSHQADALETLKCQVEDQVQQLTQSKEALSKACGDLRHQLATQNQEQRELVEQQRQSFAVEKSALTKRYQAALKEMSTKHDHDTKKMKKKVKLSEQTAARLGDELAELRMRYQYLEDFQGSSSYAPALDSTGAILSLKDDGRRGYAGAIIQHLSSEEDAALLHDIASLRLRQQNYLKAAQVLGN
ncbi:hypothetical protein CEUSTIGMA_g10287.t1 [Chlamydomonas eustigma]|uniref:Uncharacterized protein n=1 Tax=Chlamydomonas eustigma TaxID=1157962 RepID=A0A250XIF2_9CHLO|nr:hypothetical protein CEUSTIGMA_g10287.t1 [Chlamydomonas eustigma]|eukprot:GAX82861.1 hypothetical protein CEUSTIGMA_g10287.t1 [Chlamydomonas eustigma]